MATLKDQLTELESRICTLEHHTGLLRHRQQQEAQRQHTEQEAIRNTAFGGLPGEEEPLRIMVTAAVGMRQLCDLSSIAGEVNKAGFRTRRGRDFSSGDMAEILKRRGFRIPVYGVALRPSDQGVNEGVSLNLLRRLPKPIAETASEEAVCTEEVSSSSGSSEKAGQVS